MAMFWMYHFAVYGLVAHMDFYIFILKNDFLYTPSFSETQMIVSQCNQQDKSSNKQYNKTTSTEI